MVGVSVSPYNFSRQGIATPTMDVAIFLLRSMALLKNNILFR